MKCYSFTPYPLPFTLYPSISNWHTSSWLWLFKMTISLSKQMVKQITISIPESVLPTEGSDPKSFAREICLLAAVKLYELGRLTSGKAAELAGISRVEFLSKLGSYQVFPLQAELMDLESNRD